MSESDDCLFCKIIAGQIPSSKVYEDETTYAFNDINPKAKVHVLVVPKKHYANVAGLAAEVQVAVIAGAQAAQSRGVHHLDAGGQCDGDGHRNRATGFIGRADAVGIEDFFAVFRHKAFFLGCGRCS